MAKRLAEEMPQDRKIMLGVQLYDLIAKAGMQQEQVIAYYSFMSQLGMAAQAIDIVYQLNAADTADPSVYQKGTSPLESILLGSEPTADVQLKELGPDERLMAYRYQELILFKNLSSRPVMVRGRALAPANFAVFSRAASPVDDQVISHQDLIFYFNARKNVYLPQIFVKVSAHGRGAARKSEVARSESGGPVRAEGAGGSFKDVAATLNGTEPKAGTRVAGHAGRPYRLSKRERLSLGRSAASAPARWADISSLKHRRS